MIKGQLGNLKSPNRKMVETMVQNARKMRLIQDTNVLEANGYVIRALRKKDQNENSFQNQILHKISYLKTFLNYDGALLILFSKLILQNQIERYSFYESDLWDSMIKNMIDEYIITKQLGFEDNNRIQKLQNFVLNNKYNEETIRHLFPPRVGALCDFEIIEFTKPKPGEIIYKKKEDGICTTEKFVKLFPNFTSLDKTLDPKTGDFYSRVAQLYQLCTRKINIVHDYDYLKNQIIVSYNTAKTKEQDLIPLDAIEDIVCTRVLFGIKPEDSMKDVNYSPDLAMICEIMDVRKILSKVIQETKKFTTMVNRRGFPYYLKEKI